ncbi:nuclear transport factor 2 family protein [Nonomuraea zeae]|uniref:Nuclear transport factor 2 family protein n=1 Tax=Nonomuraea zeae TaxID=1642303 RepID=A0A5S4G9C6_9ACTN|nr:nuclear transport factor 2 family protein [Nonomuraea zeae]
MGPDLPPNAVLARRLYELIDDGDIDGYLDLIADDAVFHIGGDSIVAGEHRGKDAIIRLGRLVLAETSGTFQTRLLSVEANDSYAITLHHWTAERRGERVAMDNFNVYRFERGLVTERWEYVADQHAHDAFWRR